MQYPGGEEGVAPALHPQSPNPTQMIEGKIMLKIVFHSLWIYPDIFRYDHLSAELDSVGGNNKPYVDIWKKREKQGNVFLVENILYPLPSPPPLV